jgi:hypothetical protein
MRPDYITPDQAAELLGWEGEHRAKRLLRVMLAKERLRGRDIMVRAGGKGSGRRYLLTEGMLRRHCPELFLSTPEQLVADVRRHLKGIDGRVEAIVDERMAPEVERIRLKISRLDRRVMALETTRAPR